MGSMAKLKPFVREQMEKWNVPGVAIGIYDGEDVEFAGFGITNIETGQRVAPETLFQIGSISKIFTATLAMTLVDDGLLDLDAPIVTYVPELVLVRRQRSRADHRTAPADPHRRILRRPVRRPGQRRRRAGERDPGVG